MKRVINTFQSKDKNSLIYKTKILCKIASSNNAKVTYIPEIVNDEYYSKILNNKIYPELEEELCKMNNVEFFDITNLIKQNSNYFIDIMNFSKDGAKIFKYLILNKIKKYINK